MRVDQATYDVVSAEVSKQDKRPHVAFPETPPNEYVVYRPALYQDAAQPFEGQRTAKPENASVYKVAPGEARIGAQEEVRQAEDVRDAHSHAYLVTVQLAKPGLEHQT